MNRCPCSGGSGASAKLARPEGGRWSGRDTSCGTVVLQRSLVLSSGPKRQKRTRVGLLCCCFGVPRPKSSLLFRCATSKSSAYPWVRAGTNSVAIGELFGCKGNFLSAFWKRQPSIASKSSFAGEWRTCLDRRFCRSVSRSQNPPARGLDSWQSMPPDCTAAVVVSGSHTCRRAASLVRPKLSLQAHRFARCTPSGAMDHSAGCRWGSGTS